MIKAVISDLDETLLDAEKNIAPEDFKTIQILKDMGIYFIPATGRPYYSLEKTIQDLDLFDEEDMTISYNGGMIHRNIDHHVLKSHALDFEVVSKLFEFGFKEKVTMHVYVEDHTYMYFLNDDEKHHIRNFPGFEESDETSLNFLKDTPILKILYQDLDLDYLKDLEHQLPQDIKDTLEISYSSNRYLEFNPKGVSKGVAIKEVAELLNIKVEEILSIGDNLNDLSMIQIAGYAGAPQNAVEAVKKSADYISPYTYNEACVSDIIKHFIKV